MATRSRRIVLPPKTGLDEDGDIIQVSGVD